MAQHNPSANVPSQGPEEPRGDRGKGDRTWAPAADEQGISNRPGDADELAADDADEEDPDEDETEDEEFDDDDSEADEDDEESDEEQDEEK